MKKTASILWLAAGLVSAGLLAPPVSAGKAPAHARAHAKPGHKVAAAAYECPKCHMKGAKAGKCAHCKVALVKTAAHKAGHKKPAHK